MNSNRRRRTWLIIPLAGLLLAGFASRPAEEQTDQASPSDELARVLRALKELNQDSLQESACLPSICQNDVGQTWAVWEEWQGQASRLRLARLEEGQVASLQDLGCQAGFNFSPRLALKGHDSLWLIWVNYFKGEYRVFVQELSSGLVWRLGASNSASITSPRLVFDRAGNVWAFWNETSHEGVIVWRVFRQAVWSPRQILRSKAGYPALNPDVAVDVHGSIWLTWSSFDGHDYELHLARWNGFAWEEEVRLTDNQENDTFPAISFNGRNGGRLLVTWTRSAESGHQVYIASVKNGRLEHESSVSPPDSQMMIPSLLESRGEISAVWKSFKGIKASPIKDPLDDRVELSSTPASPAGFLFNPSLDENVYLCFGDSITYGYIDREPYPELGYPPRLETILKQNYGPTLSVNLGIGGENTILALARIDSVLASQQGRYILIMEGTNDIITPGLAMTTSANNLREIVRRCLQAGVYPLLATILPRKDTYGVIEYYSNRIIELNQAIRQIAADFPVSFVDMYEIFNNYPASDGGLLAVLSNDLKHPSAKGYQVMAESWFNEIKVIPFPPVEIVITSKSFQNAFLSRRGTIIIGRPTKKPSLTTGSSWGTYLAWKENPKIFDPACILGYKVYRKDRYHPRSQFRFVALIKSPLEFFDPGIQSVGRYIYLISAIRTDGVEGSCAGPISE